MRNKLLVLVLVLSLAFNAAVIGALVYHFRRGLPATLTGPWGPAENSLRDGDVRLNQKQAESIGLLRDELEKETYPIRSRMYACRQELFELLQADPPDSAAIDARIDEINALQRRMQTTVVGYMLREKEILDEDQRRIFFGRMRGRMCPGGGPEGMEPLFGRCHRGGGWGRHGR